MSLREHTAPTGQDMHAQQYTEVGRYNTKGIRPNKGPKIMEYK